MDTIFKALSDDTRRQILDMLHAKDGQTLSELEASVAAAGFEMTRFGVMKHLKVLEAAHLVVSRKEGRFKYHYLNAIPLQQVMERWIEPLTQQPLARAMIGLKTKLEGESTMTEQIQTKPDFVMQTYIKTTRERLWEALTDSDLSTQISFMGATTRTACEQGGRFDQFAPDGSLMVGGKILQITPMERLEVTFEPNWAETPGAVSRCVYEIEQQGEACCLTILHYELVEDTDDVADGWAREISSLKSFLETGSGLNFAA
ncbi:MAG: SRPBCC domain-containing protein [Pseudomonadota bacterium]